MAVKEKKKLEIEQRREVVARLLLEGHSQAAVAKRLKVTQQCISKDARALRAQWRESAVGDVAERVAVELAKLSRVEGAAWASLRASQRPLAEDSPRRPGDPKWAQAILRAVELRLKVLGAIKNDTSLSINLAQVQSPLDWQALLNAQRAPHPVEAKLAAVEALPRADTYEPLARLDELEGE